MSLGCRAFRLRLQRRKPCSGVSWIWLAWPLLVGLSVSGCTGVRPEQRAILADRIMQFGANARGQAALDHALENREGSLGGGSVQVGGCGCN